MDRKRLLYGLLSILLIILVGSLIAGFTISKKLEQSVKSDYFWESKDKAESHLVVIIDDSNQTYDEAFERGIQVTAEKYKVAVEITRVDPSNYNQDVIDALDKAKFAKVDGIVLHAFNDDVILNKIIEISDLGIPIITIDDDVPKSPRICYVGVNQYDIGQMAGQTLAQLLNGEGKLAIIDQKSYSNEFSGKEEMILLGLKEVLKEYPDLTLEVFKYTEQGVLSAETVAMEVLRENKDINGFFCIEGENTLGVAQVLIDNNLVNDVVLVGYGNESEIVEYVQKGNIIEASIVTDHEDIGTKIITAFYEYRRDNFVSSFINTDLKVINIENVEAYINEMSGVDG